VTVAGEQGASGYIVFMLWSRGDADTELRQIVCDTPEAESVMRARAEQLKANWGTDSGGQRLTIGGRQPGGKEA